MLICVKRFYDGGSREREILWRAYLRLMKHVNSIFKVGYIVFASVSILGSSTNLVSSSV